MAISYTWDKLTNIKSRLTIQGWEIERVATCFGLPNTTDRFKLAVDAIGIYIGAQYPGIIGCCLEEINPEPLDDSKDVCTVQYVYKSHFVTDNTVIVPTIEGGTVEDTVETAYDKDNQLMKVSYNGVDYPVTCNKMLCNSELLLGWSQPFILGSSSIADVQRANEGRVNVSTWQGGAAKTWLCRSIRWASTNAIQYQVKARFEYKADGWKVKKWYIDPDTGMMPKDIDTNSSQPYSIRDFELYPTASFTWTGLS